MKKIFLWLLVSFFLFPLSFAQSLESPLNQMLQCPQALPTSDPTFCASFVTSAQCYCRASGLPNSVCKDVNQLYNRLMVIFGSLERACRYQHHTSTQICIDDWNCFRNGGKDSNGALCSASGNACR